MLQESQRQVIDHARHGKVKNEIIKEKVRVASIGKK